MKFSLIIFRKNKSIFFISLLLIIGLTIISTFLLISFFSSNGSKEQIKINNSEESKTQTNNSNNISKVIEKNKTLNQEWENFKNNNKLIKCYQSKKDFDTKTNLLLPEYRKILNKEVNKIKLTNQENFTKFLYGNFVNRAKDYNIFEKVFTSTEPLSSEETDNISDLLNFIYCPDVNQILTRAPLTSNGCKELFLTWMAPFEYPKEKNYQIIEEYNLALKTFNERLKNREKQADICCDLSNSDYGIECSRFRAVMK